MGFGELLTAWVLDQPASSISLLGLPVFWWGRIGKCAQFLAGLAVVLDLIGPEKLRECGLQLQVGNSARIRRAQLILKNLHKMPTAIAIMGEKIIESQRMIISANSKAKRGKILRERDATIAEIYRDCPISTGGLLIGLSVAIAINIAMLVTVWHLWTHDYTASNNDELSWLLWRLLLLYFLVKFLPHVVCALTELFLVGARKVIDKFVIKPIAVTLTARRPGHSIKWACFCIFVVGFILDLLAS
jgi:hypothetical protein